MGMQAFSEQGGFTIAFPPILTSFYGSCWRKILASEDIPATTLLLLNQGGRKGS